MLSQEDRPKHTGTLWPSKKKKKTLKRPHDPVEDKENVPVISKQRLSLTRGTPAYCAMALRGQKRKPIEDKTVVVITDNPLPPESDKVVSEVCNAMDRPTIVETEMERKIFDRYCKL